MVDRPGERARGRHVAGVVAGLVRAMGAEFAALRVEPEAFDRPPSTDPVWLALSDGADQGGVWMAHSDVATRALGAALCGDAEGDVVARSGGAMLAGAGRRAALALAEALRQAQAWHAIDSAPGALPEGVARGGLMMSVRLGQARLPLALSAGAAQRLAGRVRGKGAAGVAAGHRPACRQAERDAAACAAGDRRPVFAVHRRCGCPGPWIGGARDAAGAGRHGGRRGAFGKNRAPQGHPTGPRGAMSAVWSDY